MDDLDDININFDGEDENEEFNRVSNEDNSNKSSGNSRPPSEKQIAFAKKLMKERDGVDEMPGWESDARICSNFIEKLLEVPGKGGGKPTEKMLNFAKVLLKERPGTEEPNNWQTDFSTCSKFIDDMLKIKVDRK